MLTGAVGRAGTPRGLEGPAVRLSDEVTHETKGRWLVDPSADPAPTSYVRRLEESEPLDQKRLFLRISADSDTRSKFVNLENSKRAPGDSEVGVTPGFDFDSSWQSHTESPDPTQRIELLP